MKSVKIISIEDFLEMLTNGEDFKLIEVLSDDHFKNGHIPGAIHIPLNDLTEKNLTKNNIRKDDTIVVYCTSYSCPASTRAAKRLLEMGYKKTLDFKAGKKGWDSAGFELEEAWDYDNIDYAGMFGRRSVAKVVA